MYYEKERSIYVAVSWDCSIVLFLVLPLLSSLIPTVFPESSFSLQLYIDFFKDSYFMAVLGRTLSISLIVTIFVLF